MPIDIIKLFQFFNNSLTISLHRILKNFSALMITHSIPTPTGPSWIKERTIKALHPLFNLLQDGLVIQFLEFESKLTLAVPAFFADVSFRIWRIGNLVEGFWITKSKNINQIYGFITHEPIQVNPAPFPDWIP